MNEMNENERLLYAYLIYVARAYISPESKDGEKSTVLDL